MANLVNMISEYDGSELSVRFNDDVEVTTLAYGWRIVEQDEFAWELMVLKTDAVGPVSGKTTWGLTLVTMDGRISHRSGRCDPDDAMVRLRAELAELMENEIAAIEVHR